MTTTIELMDLVVEALNGHTDAGTHVYSPRDWPTFDGSYPVLFIADTEEQADSLGRNAPQFNVTTTVTIEARMQMEPMNQDVSAGLVYDYLGNLREQVKKALINYTPLMTKLQQFSFFRSRIVTDPSGDQHLGRMVFEVGLEFYQGPEDFYPYPFAEVDELHLHVDSKNVFDAGGTYQNPPFPDAVNPAPRTSGPDGRDEGYLVIPKPDEETK
jgi:hypothetical protein